MLLENGEYVLAVEVKTCLTMGDVKNHVRRMEILRGAADGYNDRRKYLGAVAGARSVSYLSRKHAHRFACITAA